MNNDFLFKKYIKEIKNIDLLTESEEVELFTQLQEAKSIKNNKLYDTIKEKIALSNLRFVINIAKKYNNKDVDISELISEGNVGLLRAIDDFDVTKGFKFISYAVWWIRQSIITFFHENGTTIRLPINKIQSDFSLSFINLDKPVYENENTYTSLSDVISDDTNTLENTEIVDEELYIKESITKLVKTLDNRSKYILERYYGINCETMNLEEIGDELNLTKERVRQIKLESIKKLKSRSYLLFKYH